MKQVRNYGAGGYDEAEGREAGDFRVFSRLHGSVNVTGRLPAAECPNDEDIKGSVLALVSPEASEFPAVRDISEAGGVSLNFLDDADQIFLVIPAVVLDAYDAGFFADLFQGHSSTPCFRVFLSVRSVMWPFIDKIPK